MRISLLILLLTVASYAASDEIVTGTVGDGEINLYTAEYEDITITTGTLNGAPVSVITIEVDSLLPEDVWYPLEGGDFKELTIHDPVPRSEIEFP